jgi:hypothetical protein
MPVFPKPLDEIQVNWRGSKLRCAKICVPIKKIGRLVFARAWNMFTV